MTRELRVSERKMVEEARGVVTPRSWRVVKGMLKLDVDYPDEYWEGKEVLDVGTGIKTTDPGKVFPGAIISAIDPAFELESGEFYLDQKHQLVSQAGETSKIKESEHTAHEKKIGVASAIPYPSNRFDLTISTFALLNETRFGKAITEMIRVTKPGGEIRLSPIPNQLDNDSFIRELIDTNGFITETPYSGSNIFVIKVPNLSVEEKNERWKKLYLDFDRNGIVSKF